MQQPDLILIFSGKRKSGKDYICQKLKEHYAHENVSNELCFNFITLSSPLKEIYAREHGLDFERLLDSSDYKEKYRLEMIEWSDSKRANDPAFFCRAAVEKAVRSSNQTADRSSKFNIWLVTDARRKTDLEYFSRAYPKLVRTVRVYADEEVRKSRNWVFTKDKSLLLFFFRCKGIDDTSSECDLDSITQWDLFIQNNDEEEAKSCVQKIIHLIDSICF